MTDPNTMPDTLVDLIRHGEPVGGTLFRGHSRDDPLSDKGWRQMWGAVDDTAPWQRIVSSPMQRCHAFATALGDRHGLPVAVDDRLKEVGFGTWEGLTPQQIMERDSGEYDAFYRDPVHNRPPGAEPLNTFSARVSAAFEDAVAAHHGQHLLLVAHAGVIRAVIGHVLQAPPERWYRIKVGNAGITRIRHGKFGAVLEHHNCPPPRPGSDR